MLSQPSKRRRTHPPSQQCEGVCDGTGPVKDLPEGCWHNVLRSLSAADMGRAATVNKTCNTACNDPRLWEAQFVQEWSPESCGGVHTERAGTDYRKLCSHWQTGTPIAVNSIPGVHGCARVDDGDLDISDFAVGAVQLSRAGPLVAWSVGYDNNLLCTDMTTCQTLKSVWDIHYRGSQCLTVLDSMGLVCTGGAFGGGIKGWDSRQAGDGAALSLKIDSERTSQSEHIYAMISAGSLAGPQLITGGKPRLAHRWDLRYTDAGPVREYQAPRDPGPHVQQLECLAIEPRQGILFGGGTGGIERWDLETGERLAPLHPGGATALVVGEDCLLSGEYDGNVREWALSDPRAAVDEAESSATCWLESSTNFWSWITCMEGLGERPAGAVVGTMGGQLNLIKRGGKPVPIHYVSEDWPWPNEAVMCMAATDELLVIGTNDGALRMIRMGAP